MAKKKTTTQKKQPKNNSIKKVSTFLSNKNNQTILGAFLVLFSIFLTVAFISFFFSWQEDQSTLSQFADKTIPTKNLLGKIGAKLSNFFIYKGFGLGAFVIPVVLFLTGARILLQTNLKRIVISWNWGLLGMLWISVALGFVEKTNALLSGIIGFELNEYLQTFLGKTGLIILLLFFFIAYLIIRFSITPEKISEKVKVSKENHTIDDTSPVKEEEKETKITEELKPESKSDFELSVENLQPTITKHSEVNTSAPTNKEEITLDVNTKSETPVKVSRRINKRS